MVHLQNILHLNFKVFFMSLLLNFLLNCRRVGQIRADVCSGNVRKHQQPFAFVGKSKNLHCAHIVDLNCITQVIVEAHTCGAVDYHVEFFCESFANLW
jgi:hypothetical protein